MILMEKIVLGLGSNVGDSLGYLRNAVEAISKVAKNCRVSTVYKTKPQDYLKQDDFLNLVLVAEYDGEPEDLLALTQRIELENGRARQHEIKKGPRTIDIDILLFGDRQINTEHLTVPHPAMKNRQFVLIPLLEILPDCADPVTRKSYRYFLQDLEDQGVKKYRTIKLVDESNSSY